MYTKTHSYSLSQAGKQALLSYQLENNNIMPFDTNSDKRMVVTLFFIWRRRTSLRVNTQHSMVAKVIAIRVRNLSVGFFAVQLLDNKKSDARS